MDNQLITKDIQYTTGVVKFNNYEHYVERAKEVAKYIDSVELTDSNIKQCKTDLADARKVVKALDQARIKVKKELLEPYQDFEKKVKALQKIIDDADKRLRDQVKEIEEKERLEKKDAIREIFDKRVAMYDIAQYFDNPFELWLTPQHLNKSMSLTKVEKDMTQWLERVQKDIDTIKSMDDADMILTDYIMTLDINEAIERNQRRKEVAELVKSDEVEEVATFVIRGTANIRLAEIVLNQNGINFIKK